MQPLTDTEARFLELWNSDLHPWAVADRLGLPRKSVLQKAADLRARGQAVQERQAGGDSVRVSPKKMEVANAVLLHLAFEFKTSAEAIRSHNRQRKVAYARKAFTVAMRDCGCTWKQIMHLLGRPNESHSSAVFWHQSASAEIRGLAALALKEVGHETELTGFPEVESIVSPTTSRAAAILLAALNESRALDLDAIRPYVRDRALEDGAKHHRESETVVIELERRDLWHLFEHVSPDRKSPVTLIQVLGHTVETIRDRARDSLDGPGERNVQVHYSECVFGHLLNIRIAGGQAEAEIEFVAEFESFLIGSEQ